MSSKDEDYQRLPTQVSDVQKEYKKSLTSVAGSTAGMRKNRPAAYLKEETGFKVGGKYDPMGNVQLDQLKDIHHYLKTRYS